MDAKRLHDAVKDFLSENVTGDSDMWDDDEMMRYLNFAQRYISNRRDMVSNYLLVRIGTITMDGTGVYDLPADCKRVLAIEKGANNFLWSPAPELLTFIHMWRGLSVLTGANLLSEFRWSLYNNVLRIEPQNTTGTLTVYYARKVSEMHYGTAAAAAATTITLAASPTAGVTKPVDDFYNNDTIEIVSGTGAGQQRVITDYVGSTRVATVATWTTTPDGTSVYSINSDLDEDFEECLVLRAGKIALLKEGQKTNPQIADHYNESLQAALDVNSLRQSQWNREVTYISSD